MKLMRLKMDLAPCIRFARAHPTILVTDVGLPGALNGRQVADAAREAFPDLRVLFVTGFAEASVLKGGFLTPSTAVITKPFDIQVLLNKVTVMLRQPQT